MDDPINLAQAAEFFNFEQHQIEAWEWLQANTPRPILDKFAGRYRGKAKPSVPTKTSQLGQELIKHFEGCQLASYLCPAGVWTIGYGRTGPDVVEDLHITQAVAEQMLRDDLDRFEQAVFVLVEAPLKQCEFDALVSFAYNCGSGALRESTLRRRLNAREEKAQVFLEELPRWTSGGLKGLVRRRQAEVRLATTGQFP